MAYQERKIHTQRIKCQKFVLTSSWELCTNDFAILISTDLKMQTFEIVGTCIGLIMLIHR